MILVAKIILSEDVGKARSQNALDIPVFELKVTKLGSVYLQGFSREGLFLCSKLATSMVCASGYDLPSMSLLRALM